MSTDATREIWSYDLIAAFYATDMGLSMPFDDVGFYANLARDAAGPTLELGCGTGRILIELLASGINITGVDRSLPMLKQLRQDASSRSLKAVVAQMDLRALALRDSFALILAPYSLITYLADPEAVDAFVDQARALLTAGGALVWDSFIPRDVTSFDDFRQDYSRDYQGGRLQRAKRIAVLNDGCNRIERRYRQFSASGDLLQEVHTQERIRPQSPAQLRALAQRHGLHIDAEHFDYGQSASIADARFYTLIARVA